MATAAGRNFFANNFAREVFLHFNLPPLHSLMQKFIPMILDEVEKKNKQYIGRDEGILRQTRTFKYAEISSSIGNFRNKEHEKFNGVH